jgi:hypothetical protein
MTGMAIARAMVLLLGCGLWPAAQLAAEPAALPGGQTLAGLAADGERLLTHSRDDATCWTVRLHERRGADWVPVLTGVRDPASREPCGPTIAALSSDGRRVAVHDFTHMRTTVLRRERDTYEVEAQLRLNGREGFATSAAPVLRFDRDGSQLLVGAPNYECVMGFPGPRCGTSQLFVRDGTRWAEGAALRFFEPRLFALAFGTVGDIAPDGRSAVVGGTGIGGDPGMLYWFERDGAVWHFHGTLMPTRREEGVFGQAVALSADGRTLAVGGEEVVRIFAAEGEGWRQLQELRAGDRDVGGFGMAIAMTGDGASLVVGAPRTRCGVAEPRCGRAFLFRRAGGRYGEPTPLAPTTPVAFSDFGYRVAIDDAGRRAAIQGHRPFVFELGR